MFEATRMMYLYVETPLHAGTGRSMGAVDLPIQRERVTGFPIVQSSSVKGRLRAEAEARPNLLPKADLLAIFGPETAQADEYAGALAPGDARLLLFPVRSLSGVFAWTTSVEVLERFGRDLQMINAAPSSPLPRLPSVAGGKILVSGNDVIAVQDVRSESLIKPGKILVNGNDVIAGSNQVVLEEYSFEADASQQAVVQQLGQWLATNTLPSGPEYDYWRKTLPRRLVILENNAFRDFTQFSTEVQTHVKLNQEKKTVEKGALWTEECLPTDSLLYAPLCATKSRKDGVMDGAAIINKIVNLNIGRMQLGGNETTGRGIVCVRF